MDQFSDHYPAQSESLPWLDSPSSKRFNSFYILVDIEDNRHISVSYRIRWNIVVFTKNNKRKFPFKFKAKEYPMGSDSATNSYLLSWSVYNKNTFLNSNMRFFRYFFLFWCFPLRTVSTANLLVWISCLRSTILVISSQIWIRHDFNLGLCGVRFVKHFSKHISNIVASPMKTGIKN